MTNIEHLRFPIGKFQPPSDFTDDNLEQCIEVIGTYPDKVRQAVFGLTNEQLETPYRPGGWTIRQVVHHLADSHMNSIIRFKLALTEDNPTIKPYEEDQWAMLADYNLPIDPSLKMLDGIHQRMVALFESFTRQQLQRTFYHPASGETYELQKVIALYAWHSQHHLAHIELAKKRFRSF